MIPFYLDISSITTLLSGNYHMILHITVLTESCMVRIPLMMRFSFFSEKQYDPISPQHFVKKCVIPWQILHDSLSIIQVFYDSLLFIFMKESYLAFY